MAWATMASADVLQTFGLLIFGFLLFCWLVIHLSYQGTVDIDALYSQTSLLEYHAGEKAWTRTSLV
jgi:hypothetical protein